MRATIPRSLFPFFVSSLSASLCKRSFVCLFGSSARRGDTRGAAGNLRIGWCVRVEWSEWTASSEAQVRTAREFLLGFVHGRSAFNGS